VRAEAPKEIDIEQLEIESLKKAAKLGHAAEIARAAW
jgi:hypothetical protein